jgi:hypothetical protein
MQAAALALYFASDTIYYRSDFDDWDAQDVANRLWVAGQYLDEFDYAWCAAVSTVGMWGCDYNDAIVPISSQLDPTAIMVYTGAEHGPPHTREIDEAKSWIIEAMTVWSNVAYRPSERPPPPPPPPPAPDRLLPYESLHPYQGITSADGRFSLIYQDDGNLVLYRLADWTPLWASNTYGTSAGEVIMQGDGLLVIYDGPLGNGGNPVWTSGTWNIWVTPNRAPQQRQSGRVHG